MRAHSIRRTLWFANVLLGAGVVALGAWLFTDVLPAAADPVKVKAEYAAKVLEAYKAKPNAARVENSAVSMEDVKTINRPEYEKLNYWIFSGPPPPAPQEAKAVVEGPPPPTGLETLGRVLFMLYIQPDKNARVAASSVVTWQFPDKKLGRFKPGQFVRAPGQKDRFKLVDVRRPDPDVPLFDLVYDVYDDPSGKPVKTGVVLQYDARPPPGKAFKNLTPPDATAVVAGTPAEGTAEKAGPAAGGTPARGVVPATSAGPVGSEAPRPAPAFEELKPKITRTGADRIDIEFDQATYDYVRGKSVESLAETVKTQPAVDRKTGQPLGLRITGFSGNSPADKFDVKPGDILVSVNGVKIRDRAELVALVQRMPADTRRVTVVIERNGNLITFNIDPQDPKTRRAARYLDENR